jgi:hypothetical protein
LQKQTAVPARPNGPQKLKGQVKQDAYRDLLKQLGKVIDTLKPGERAAEIVVGIKYAPQNAVPALEAAIASVGEPLKHATGEAGKHVPNPSEDQKQGVYNALVGSGFVITAAVALTFITKNPTWTKAILTTLGIGGAAVGFGLATGEKAQQKAGQQALGALGKLSK